MYRNIYAFTKIYVFMYILNCGLLVLFFNQEQFLGSSFLDPSEPLQCKSNFKINSNNWLAKLISKLKSYKEICYHLMLRNTPNVSPFFPWCNLWSHWTDFRPWSGFSTVDLEQTNTDWVTLITTCHKILLRIFI